MIAAPFLATGMIQQQQHQHVTEHLRHPFTRSVFISPHLLRHSRNLVCVWSLVKQKSDRKCERVYRQDSGTCLYNCYSCFCISFLPSVLYIITDDCCDTNFQNGITVCWFSEMLQWRARDWCENDCTGSEWLVWCLCVCLYMFDSIQMLAYSSLNQIMNNCYNVNVDVKSSQGQQTKVE